MKNITGNIYAVELPEGTEKVEKLNKESLPISLICFKKNGSSYPIPIYKDFELLGVISNGEIPNNILEELAESELDKIGLWLNE